DRPQRFDRAHDGEKHATQVFVHRGLCFALERLLGPFPGAEHHVAAGEHRPHLGEPGRLETLLQLRHFRIRRHHTAEECRVLACWTPDCLRSHSIAPSREVNSPTLDNIPCFVILINIKMQCGPTKFSKRSRIPLGGRCSSSCNVARRLQVSWPRLSRSPRARCHITSMSSKRRIWCGASGEDSRSSTLSTPRCLRT